MRDKINCGNPGATDEIKKICYFHKLKSARRSSQEIYEIFLNYLESGDFIGADTARKFLQVGYSKAQRCASNYKQLLRGTIDERKLKVAEIYRAKWKAARQHKKYLELFEKFQNNKIPAYE